MSELNYNLNKKENILPTKLIAPQNKNKEEIPKWLSNVYRIKIYIKRLKLLNLIVV